MKIKTKKALSATKGQSKKNGENDLSQINWRQIGLRLAAIFLVIVFLVSECATLLPLE